MLPLNTPFTPLTRLPVYEINNIKSYFKQVPFNGKEDNMNQFYNVNIRLGIGLMTAFVMLFTSPASGDEDRGIASLYSFEGNIAIKSKGVWGIAPRKGMPIYHGDKFITGLKDSLSIRFNDGSLLDILPNSNVRVAELIGDEGLTSSKDTRKREIRVFVGTVIYKSSPNSGIKTKLISPKSFTLIPSDSENRFGTDGNLAFISRSKKYGDPVGDITEGNVPEISEKQAAENQNYQTALAAAKMRKIYADAVEKLTASRFGSGILFASGSASLNALIPAQNAGSEEEKKTADQVLEMGAVYSVLNNKNLIVENESLLNNPEPEVKERAERGLRFSQESLRKAEQALQLAEQTAEEVTRLASRAMKGDTEQIRQAFEMLKPVVSDMIKRQKSINAEAMGKELLADHVTAGYVIDIRRLEEEMQNQANEEAREIYGEDIEIGDETISAIIERIMYPRPNPKPDSKPKPRKDKGWPEYWVPDLDNKPKPYGQ